jgi:hypothetical protein
VSLSARHLLLLAKDVASLSALSARSFDRLSSEGSPRWFPVIGAAMMMLHIASTPCWAKVTSGEFGETIRWIDSMIVWSLTVSKSGFRFRTILLLGGPCIRFFRSSYGWVLVGVVLRIAPGWAHHADAAGFNGRVLTSTALNLRIVFSEIPIRSCSRR